MKVLERRFLRGPNIHHMAPCLVTLVDFDGHQPHAAELACLLARLVRLTQTWVGSPGTFSEAVPLATAAAHRYRLVCDYQHEAVAEEALRLAVDLVTALAQRRSFDLGTRLARLRALARAAAPAAAPLHRMPVVAVTGTNGKTTTTQLIAHVLRAEGARTGTTTTQGIFIDGRCVRTGDCSGHHSARRVLADRSVDVATLETARGGILKRGLGFDRCDVGVVLNVSSDHLGLDGIETLEDLARVKGLVARSARTAAVLNADDPLCVAMRDTLAPGCQPVFFTLDPTNPVFVRHLEAGGSGGCLDEHGWLVWCQADRRTPVVRAAELPFTWQGSARYNTANALAALAALVCMGSDLGAAGRAMARFESDAHDNPMRGNHFDVDGIRLIVDYAHNVAAYRAVAGMARSMLGATSRLVGVITSPGDRRPRDLFETGRVCGRHFDELLVYEHDPRGRQAGATARAILDGARDAGPDKPLHAELCIRAALSRGLKAARPGDVLVFACAGGFDDVIAGVRLVSPAAADRIASGLAARQAATPPERQHETVAS